MTTYLVHIKLGDKSRDLYVEAHNESEAIHIARQLSSAYERRWAAYVV